MREKLAGFRVATLMALAASSTLAVELTKEPDPLEPRLDRKPRQRYDNDPVRNRRARAASSMKGIPRRIIS